MLKYSIFIVVLTILISCASNKLNGVYKREYEISGVVEKIFKKEKLIITGDSSFLWIRYIVQPGGVIKDSSIEYGICKNKSKNLYTLKGSLGNNSFCIIKKNKGLFFYDCIIGKKLRYNNPFLKE